MSIDKCLPTVARATRLAFARCRRAPRITNTGPTADRFPHQAHPGPTTGDWMRRCSASIVVGPSPGGLDARPLECHRQKLAWLQVNAQDGTSVMAVWRKRLTWATAPPGSFRVGTIVAGEQLFGLKVGCPRCEAPSVATIWRRFDYSGREYPAYFTKCRRCHRRTMIDPDDAAFLLLDAGVANPVELVRESSQSTSEENTPQEDNDILSVSEAEDLLHNRQRAYGEKHPLTFEARSQLAEAVGETGEPTEAVRIYQQLLLDQQTALRPDHPEVLANRYRAAVWTARDGHPSPALVSLNNLLVDQERAMGPDHHNTLAIRGTVARA